MTSKQVAKRLKDSIVTGQSTRGPLCLSCSVSLLWKGQRRSTPLSPLELSTLPRLHHGFLSSYHLRPALQPQTPTQKYQSHQTNHSSYLLLPASMSAKMSGFDAPKEPKAWRDGNTPPTMPKAERDLRNRGQPIKSNIIPPTMPKADRIQRDRGQPTTSSITPPSMPKADRVQRDRGNTTGVYKPAQQRYSGEAGMPYAPRSSFKPMAASTSMPRDRLAIVPEHETIKTPLPFRPQTTRAYPSGSAAPAQGHKTSSHTTTPPSQSSGG